MAEGPTNDAKIGRMHTLLFAYLLITLVSPRGLTQTPPNIQPAAIKDVPVTHALDGGYRLIVTSTRIASEPDLRPVLGDWIEPDVSPVTFIFSLQFPGGASLPLYSTLYTDPRNVPASDQWRILDAVLIKGSLIFAAYQNPGMSLMRYDFGSNKTELDNLENGRWNLSSVSVKLSGSVKVSLNKNDAGRCTVEVIYEREGLRRITHFVQTGDKWKFHMTDEKNIVPSNARDSSK